MKFDSPTPFRGKIKEGLLGNSRVGMRAPTPNIYRFLQVLTLF